MLAKEKLDQLNSSFQNLSEEKKVIEAFELDLIHTKKIDSEDVPSNLKNIRYDNADITLYKKTTESKTIYFYKRKISYNAEGAIYNWYQFTIAEDFDLYYGEIKAIIDRKKANTNSIKSVTNVEQNESSKTYNFIVIVASLLLIIGLLGALNFIGVLPGTIVFASLLSLFSIVSILLGLAKIIDLLNK